MGPLAPAKLAFGVLSVALVAVAMGYVIASAVLTFQDVGFQAEIDFFYIARNYLSIRTYRPEDFRLINLIMGGAGVAGLLMSLAMSGSALTRFGQTHWQTRRELKRNGFFGSPGTGFIIGKLGKPGLAGAIPLLDGSSRMR